MAPKSQASSIGWRRSVTGQDENGHDVHVYEFGGEIDGVFVPAVTKQGGYIDTLVSRGKENQSDDDGDDDGDSDGAKS